jgi:hypothetical protein
MVRQDGLERASPGSIVGRVNRIAVSSLKRQEVGKSSWRENWSVHELIVDAPLLGGGVSRCDGTAASKRLRCAIRTSLIHQLLSSVEIMCESAADDELDFVCDVLRMWRQLSEGKTSAAPLLSAFVAALNKLACVVQVPKDSVQLVERYLVWAEANLTQAPSV